MQSFRADEGIETVIERYAGMVYGIALTHTRNQTDAEDVFQEVFLAYHRKNPAFNDEEHRKAWLIRTAINCSKRVLGSSWRRKTVSIEEISDVFTYEAQEQGVVYDALCALPLMYRVALHLFYFEDMTIEQVGKALRAKPGTVKSRLSRGRVLLREKLKGEYFNE